MLKRKNGLFAVSRPALPSAAVGRLALHNIEEGGGRTVSEVGERYFCKHRYLNWFHEHPYERELGSQKTNPDPDPKENIEIYWG